MRCLKVDIQRASVRFCVACRAFTVIIFSCGPVCLPGHASYASTPRIACVSAFLSGEFAL
eukprot:1150170-Pelagomonas_calceolata.AAC.7